MSQEQSERECGPRRRASIAGPAPNHAWPQVPPGQQYAVCSPMTCCPSLGLSQGPLPEENVLLLPITETVYLLIVVWLHLLLLVIC